MNKWISVKDRLPEEKGEYLVAFHPCYWDNVNYEIVFVGIDSFRGKSAWAKKKFQRITHWMPLPEPPGCDARTAHSRWTILGKTRYVWVCANCGYGEGMTCSEEDDSENDANPYWNYCPYCGAEMDMGTCERDAEI